MMPSLLSHYKLHNIINKKIKTTAPVISSPACMYVGIIYHFKVGIKFNFCLDRTLFNCKQLSFF